MLAWLVLESVVHGEGSGVSRESRAWFDGEVCCGAFLGLTVSQKVLGCKEAQSLISLCFPQGRTVKAYSLEVLRA